MGIFIYGNRKWEEVQIHYFYIGSWKCYEEAIDYVGCGGWASRSICNPGFGIIEPTNHKGDCYGKAEDGIETRW